jgi:hypothetical protein
MVNRANYPVVFGQVFGVDTHHGRSDLLSENRYKAFHVVSMPTAEIGTRLAFSRIIALHE